MFASEDRTYPSSGAPLVTIRLEWTGLPLTNPQAYYKKIVYSKRKKIVYSKRKKFATFSPVVCTIVLQS